MEIKYEAVFGPQHLFKSTNAEVIVVGPRGDKTESNIGLMAGNTPDGYVIVAMRRIIKEPKRWTWEDKKAGKLPDVGSKLICTETWDAFEFVGVIAGSMRWACKDFQDGFLYFFEQSEMSPIETPEEKAQREEDEFVVAMLDAASQEQLMSAGFKSGVIAAYRKLKGGDK